MSRSCETCAWWDRIPKREPDNQRGHCRHDPPRIVDAILPRPSNDPAWIWDDVGLASGWPITCDDDWCSRHMPTDALPL